MAILLFSIQATMAQAQDLTLPEDGTDPVILRVLNGTPHPEMLEVTLHGAETPIAGRYEVDGGLIRFTPAFGFDPGRDYVVRLPNDNQTVSFRLSTDMAQITPAVTDIYPSGDTLPENTLRFYIHFTVPMQSHVAFDYIKLLDASGVADDAALMQFKQELWNEDRTRLTVLIDPGRIKREVATNVELGPALLAGEQYTLSVSGGWPSADGATMLPAFTKTFQVSEALRTLPDSKLWTSNAPCVGTRDPLTVTFDRPFDRHLLTHALRLQTEVGRSIDGVIDVTDAEHAATFTPLEPWTNENLVLIANPVLEDVAGNNFRGLLDHTSGQQENNVSTTALAVRVQNCAD